ncbi:MAG: hypothetical protein QM775_28950 [Pirellulales bacterium]
MAEQFSPHVEAFIADALAHGDFPSRHVLLEKAVEALRRQQDVPEVPEIHAAAVDEGLESIVAGRHSEWRAEDAVRRLEERLAKRAANGQ